MTTYELYEKRKKFFNNSKLFKISPSYIITSPYFHIVGTKFYIYLVPDKLMFYNCYSKRYTLEQMLGELPTDVQKEILFNLDLFV